MSGNSNLDELSKALALSMQTHLDTHCESVKSYLNTLDLNQSVLSSISEKLYQNNELVFTEIFRSLNVYTENLRENDINLNAGNGTQENQFFDKELEELNRELTEQKLVQSKLKHELSVSQQELGKTKNYLSLLDDCKALSGNQGLIKINKIHSG